MASMEIQANNYLQYLKFTEHQCLLIFLLIFLTIPVDIAESSERYPNFTFNGFHDDAVGEIKLEGDAYLQASVIKLTSNLNNVTEQVSVGRATYREPMHLVGLADFTTQFSFGISSQGNRSMGEGFTFFLASNGSQLPPNSGNGCLGLMNCTDAKSATTEPARFVAVEFDTTVSDWDAYSGQDHIGIDLNLMQSVKTVNWNLNGTISCRISYDSSSKNLSVFVSNGDVQSDTALLFFAGDLRTYLEEWVILGFSASTTTDNLETNEVYSWEFTSRPLLETETGKAASTPVFTIIGCVIGVLLILILALVCFCFWMKRRGIKGSGSRTRRYEELGTSKIQQSGMHMSLELENQRSAESVAPRLEKSVTPRPERVVSRFQNEWGPRSFTYEELVTATDNFTSRLGKGGFGEVYEGILKDRKLKIAVKKINSNNTDQGLKQFESEVKSIGQLGHRNLVKLIGWCHGEQELLLVYEYMPNGSLDFHLFKDSQYFLTWERRWNIVLNMASALLYLHEECNECVLHRDIKPQNVLLDEHFNAKLGDFGLARLVEHESGAHLTNTLIMTYGYVAPEYVETRTATKRTDIYSFGVVALQLACGKKPTVEVADVNGFRKSIYLVEWAWEHFGKGNLLAVADPILGQDFDKLGMERLICVGLKCAHPNHEDRPLVIKEAINMLTGHTSLPDLPRELPNRVNIKTLSFTSLTDPEAASAAHPNGNSQDTIDCSTTSEKYHTAKSFYSNPK